MKAKMATATTPTTTMITTLKIQPALRRKVLEILHTYERLSQQRTALKAALEGHQASLKALFEKAGASEALMAGISLNGFKLKTVESSRTDRAKFNRHLVSLGVSIEMLEEAQARATVSCKSYLKVTTPTTVPGEHENDSESS